MNNLDSIRRFYSTASAYGFPASIVVKSLNGMKGANENMPMKLKNCIEMMNER